jgi:hypothetical protein
LQTFNGKNSRNLKNNLNLSAMSCSEKEQENIIKVKAPLFVTFCFFLNYSYTRDYRTNNNLMAGQSFNENLLYLSPVLKKENFY